MAKDTREFDKDGTATAADEAIRRFLLGSAGSDEQARLAESLFTDEALEERVRAAECELADDYAFQRLSAAEREQFEQRFLVSNGRQRKLEVSVALRQHFASQAAAKESVGPSPHDANDSLGNKFFDWLGFNRPVVGFAFALILLVVFGSVIWRTVRNRREKQLIAKERITAKQSPVVTATPELSHVLQPSPTPELSHSPKPTPPAVEHEAASVLASVLLLPNAVRDGGEMARLTMPNDPKRDQAIVRLELALEIDAPGSLSAELLTAEGVAVFAGHKLKISTTDSTRRVVFDVPAHSLKNGDYQVKLNWIVAGSVTGSRRYYFRVTE